MINPNTYLKFLSRNKLYTFVSVAGFSISLMFVIILGLYVTQELSVDDFHKNRDRIFMLADGTKSILGNTVPQFVKDNCPEVESFVRVLSRETAVGKRGDDKLRVKALFVDSTFFRVFSYKVLEGDPARVLEAHKTAVVTRSFAARYFGNEDPVGKTLFIDNGEHTVTGIAENMPENTIMPDAEIFVNYHSITQYWGDWALDTSHNFGFTAFFLAKEGADFRSKAPALFDLLKENFWYFQLGFGKSLQIISLKEAYFTLIGSGYGSLKYNSRTTITIYLAIAVLILVIALLNYINLTVAQAGFRGRESAIKKLLGGSKAGLISQLLAESLLITAVTFLAGLLLAFLTEPFFDGVLNTSLNLASRFTTPAVIAVCFLFVLAVSFLAGILPALVISNFDPLEVVKGTFARKVKTTYSQTLIIFQYTVVTALLICAVFIRRQSDYLINYDTGYDREGILEIDNTGLSMEQIEGFRAELMGIPGVETVSFSCGTPLNGGNNMSYELDGEQFSFQEFYVDSAFFRIYGIEIEPTGIPPAEDASSFWLGKRAYKSVEVDTATQTFRGWGGSNERKVQVAGVFDDFKIRSLEQDYSLLRIRRRRSDETPWDIIVKMVPGTDYYATAKRVEKAYAAYTEGELFEALFVDEGIRQNYEKIRKTSSVMSAFTLLTIIIMVMGVFAMSLYLIRRKEKEIALRKINGATEREVLLLLNRDSLKRIAIAFVIAVPVAWYAMTKWFENFPYRISLSWWVFVAAGLAVLLLTLVSVSYMTWKAARANPVKFLKNE